MGAWGITMRQSDYGLDLLGIVVKDIKRTNRGCPPEELDYYINANFPQGFTQAALLIAECLADYYRTGELIVTEYVGEKYDPVCKCTM